MLRRRFAWLFEPRPNPYTIIYDNHTEVLQELRKTRMTVMAIFDELKDALADLAMKIDKQHGNDDAHWQAQLDSQKAALDAKYDHDIGEANTKYANDMAEAKKIIDDLRAKFDQFEPSNNA